MKFPKKLYFIIPAIVIIVPIVMNYILTREKVCDYDVAGSGVDWISFYGSFLGSVLSASIAYYVLLKTIEAQKSIDLKNQKIREYEQLKDDLSERISQIEITDIFRALLHPNQFDIKDELDRLSTLLYSYKAKINSSVLKYGLDEGDEKCNDFFNEYNSMLCDMCVAISKMMEILAKHQYSKDDEALAKDLLVMNKEMVELNKRPESVFRRALSYCLSKKNELELL